MMDRKKIFKQAAILVSVIFLLNTLADKLLWYNQIWWFDMVMHFSGGFFIGLLFFCFFRGGISIPIVLKAILFVFCIGLSWEIYEIIVNNIFAKDPFDLLDTLSDLFFDLFGGICAILYLWKIRKANQ